MFRIHHIDIWIENIQDSINFYETLGFKKIKEIDGKDKKIIFMKINDIFLEMKYHYNKNCNHNNTICKDNKVFGLSVPNINQVKELIENNKFIDEKIIIKNGILGKPYFVIRDPNGILIEFIEE